MSDDREKPKKSWRDIDKAKDGSSHRKDEPKRQTKEATGAQKQYRATLDRLFDQGEAGRLLGKNRTTEKVDAKADTRLSLIRAVRDAIGRDDITRAVDKLLELGSLPQEEEVLTQAIEHRDEAKARMALEGLLSWLDRNRLRRQATLKARLQGMVDNANDDETRELARKVRDKLG
jgi:hypothetical protein